MKNITLATAFLFVSSHAYGSSACLNAPLTTYLNNGAFFSCTEAAGSLTVKFNHDDILPSYVGLNLLSANNNAANPAAINVAALSPGLEFDSGAFTENSIVLSSQAELVHFLLDAGPNSVTSTMLSLDNVSTNSGGLGAGLAVGQELLCVGGTFTSLPTGLVTSVANGLLGTGAFGCNGTALIGTVASSAGALNLITDILGLPNLSGLTDTATIQLSPVNRSEVDVIKLQALVSVLGGSASDTGFGNTYTVSAGGAAATPEPGSLMMMLAAGVLLTGNRYWVRHLGRLRNKVARRSA